MSQIAAIALGGAVGAALRWWVSTRVYAWLGQDFPFGTLVVNVLGSFLMGLLVSILLERFSLDGIVRALLLIGFLGAFTTFSTFAMETVALLEQGAWFKAMLNASANVLLCVLATWLGLSLGRGLAMLPGGP